MSLDRTLRVAKRHASRRRFSFSTTDGGRIAFAFVGVLDLLHLGIECEPEEVWYNIVQLVRPMERRRKLIPAERQLNAIQWEAPAKRLERPGGRGPRHKRTRFAADPSAERP